MAITTLQFSTLDDIYNYYNELLFDNELPQCLVNLSRMNGAYGFFAPERWKDTEDMKVVHEISINPDHMNREDVKWHSTLVHEMCHLWQEEFGKPSRRCYHNKEFASIMEKAGLITSTTGAEGGARTGQSMTHYVQKDGLFDKAFNQIMNNEDYLKLRITLKPNTYLEGSDTDNNTDDNTDDPSTGKSGKVAKITKGKAKGKIKYTCSCGFNIWGKTELDIKCNECNENFIEEE